MKKTAALISAFALAMSSAAIPPATVSAEQNGVVINEICAKNTTFAAADGSYYDWIELYNNSAVRVDLSGYGLSDKESKPYKYIIPDGTTIESGGRLLIFCDSKAETPAGQLMAAFGLSTSGETVTLTDANGVTVDTVTFGEIDPDVSYGRVTDGSDSFAYMQTTPNAPNAKGNTITAVVSKPVLSKDSGFYPDAFSLTLSADSGCKIFYTLDGSDPTSESTEYTSAINISDISASANVLSARTDIAPTSFFSSVTAPKSAVDKAVVVKAAAMDEDGNLSDTVTATYFVGYQNKAAYYQNIKVISIVTDSDNLFDYEKGIYVLGKSYDDWKNGSEYDSSVPEYFQPANYTQKGAEWEREATMQIFENGSLSASQNVGIRIHGGATRSQPQKSFNVYARSKYGESKLDFDLFSGNVSSEYSGDTITEFDSFVLRNGGNDSQYTRFRDKLNQALVSDRDFLTQGMEPCIVFIDGEYWGQYEITEKLSDSFIKSHYGVSKKNVCIVKNEELDEGDEETFSEWEQMREWINSTDFSDGESYNALCEKIDMQSFIDYMSAEIYFNNWDWGDNNMAMWKSTQLDSSNPYADGKWRFVMFDTEYSTNLYGQTGATTNSFSQIMKSDCFLAELMGGAMKNDEFRKQFVLTFMDMANENFDSAKVSALISELSAAYHDTTIDTYNRFWCEWPGGFMAESSLSKEVDSVKTFYNSRFTNITGSMKSAFSLSGNLAEVTVKNDTSKGSVTVNTISPDFSSGSWSGKYYTDYPITVSATSENGYKLAYFETSTGEKIYSDTAEITFNSDITITAVYEEDTSVRGDVNADGKFDISDLVMMQKFLLGNGTLTDWKAGDLCMNGKIDVFDLVAMRRLITE